MQRRFMLTGLWVLLCGGLAAPTTVGEDAVSSDTPAPLSLIVMDPLAAPLSCPCVEGYAQRKYEVLAQHLQQQLGRKVMLTFGESLATALKKADGRCDIVIGKDSVVRADATAQQRNVVPLGHLTDLQGSTEQYGMIVVNRDDPAQKLEELTGYSIIFGPKEADEKHAAAMQMLTAAGIAVPETLTIDEACSDGACKVIDLGPQSRTAAVISSYAQPLLEGCGTIRKGDLRVVGKTAPVPFITAFAVERLDAAERDQVRDVLLNLSTEPPVLEALESLVGFVPAKDAKPESVATVAKKK